MVKLRVLTGWPFDLAAALVLTTLAVTTAPSAPLARCLVVAMCLPVAVRSRVPLVAVSVPAVAHVASTALGFLPPNVPGFIALLLCLYSVAAEFPSRVSAAAALMISGGATFVVWTTGPLVLALCLAAITATWFMAHDLRTRRELVRAMEERARSAEERAAAEERARIAREVHDVVSHTVGVIAVQAGAARHLFDSDPPEAKQALAAVEKTARDALHDLRTLLEVLGSDIRLDKRPQPGVEELAELMRSFTEAGLRIDSEISLGDPLPTAADVSVFRIVQEALTNCLRHAPGAPVRLEVRQDRDAVRISVHNGPCAPTSSAGAGRGLEGMRQRVKMFAGEMSAGPAPDGGWSVTVRLPLEAPRV
jgi:signal transduction histidine kinase